jgi:hypothetical protein
MSWKIGIVESDNSLSGHSEERTCQATMVPILQRRDAYAWNEDVRTIFSVKHASWVVRGGKRIERWVAQASCKLGVKCFNQPLPNMSNWVGVAVVGFGNTGLSKHLRARYRWEGEEL